MKTKAVIFEMDDFRLLKDEFYVYSTKCMEAAILREFCKRGLFVIDEHAYTHDDEVCFRRTDEGKEKYESFLYRFERILNNEMEIAYKNIHGTA